MKRELIFLIGLSSAIYATQEISCVDFVNLQKADAKSYLDNYRKGFELNHFKTKNHTDIDKQYIGMQGGVSRHLLNCLDLRRVTHYGVQDVRRALILTSLSKKNLTQEEQSIYERSLNENIAFYRVYSNSSITGQYMPLVYLTIELSKDNQHYIIYEFRKNGAEITRHDKKILVSKPYIKFSNINAVSNQNYLSYIQQQYPNIQLYKAKREANTITKQVNVTYQNSQNIYSGEEYIVINSFDILHQGANPANPIMIYPKRILKKLREEHGNVYFLDEHNNEYFASKIWWEKGTRKLGGER